MKFVRIPKWNVKFGIPKVKGHMHAMASRFKSYRRATQSGSPVVRQGRGGSGGVMRGGKQQDVPGRSAGRGRAGSGDDDNLMIFAKIDAAIV